MQIRTRLISFILMVGLALLPGFALSSVASAQTAPRLALVIGNAQYTSHPLATPANDAGLVAQTLQEQGFDVTAAADLNLDQLRQAFHDFLAKVEAAGPQSIAFVYLAGRGVQYAGDNFFVPVDAVIDRAADVPLAALRLSDYMQALASMPAQARIVVIDGARGNDFVKNNQNGGLAGGLALVEPGTGALYAFNAAPDTVAPDEGGPYGAYAQALVEMLQQGGSIDDVFALTRVRVGELTRGAVIPWDDTRLDPSFALTPGQKTARQVGYDKRPLRTFSSADAYAIVVERDTISGYEDFIAAYPNDPLIARVRALLAARREAMSWRRAFIADTPAAYWSYMRRYPHGPHFWDARRRLTVLRAELQPPAHFDVYDFGGLPPPPQDEYVIIDRPVIVFEGADYPPPPPAPLFILPVMPERFRHLPPPVAAPRGLVPMPAGGAGAQQKPGGHAGTIAPPNFGQQGAQPQGGHPQGGQPHGTPQPAAQGAHGAPVAPGTPAASPPANAPPAPPNTHGSDHSTDHGQHVGTKPAPAPATPPKPTSAPPARASSPATPPATTTHPAANPVAPPPVVPPTAKPQSGHPEGGYHDGKHEAPAGQSAPPTHPSVPPKPAPQAAPAPVLHGPETHAAPPHPAPTAAPHPAPAAQPHPEHAPAAAAPPHPAPHGGPEKPPAKPGAKPDDKKGEVK